MANPSVLCRFLRWPSTEAPFLYQHYPASLVIWASPPPHTAQPDSHESPVDPVAITAGVSRVASGPRCLHAVAITPAGPMNLFAQPVRRRRPSPISGRVDSCVVCFEACSAFTRVTACMLTESPCDPLHRRLQQLCYLHCCSDCYRAERTSSREGLSPSVDQRLSTAHVRCDTSCSALPSGRSV